jgi:hypothetical protein
MKLIAFVAEQLMTTAKFCSGQFNGCLAFDRESWSENKRRRRKFTTCVNYENTAALTDRCSVITLVCQLEPSLEIFRVIEKLEFAI